jgi:hypothetical protein
LVVGGGAGGVADCFDWGVLVEKGTGGREGGRGGGGGGKARRTEASDGEGCAEPGAGFVDLPGVEEGGEEEEDGEDDGGGDGGEVEPEVVAVHCFELGHGDGRMWGGRRMCCCCGEVEEGRRGEWLMFFNLIITDDTLGLGVRDWGGNVKRGINEVVADLLDNVFKREWQQRRVETDKRWEM